MKPQITHIQDFIVLPSDLNKGASVRSVRGSRGAFSHSVLPVRYIRRPPAPNGTDQNAAIHLYTHERACPEVELIRFGGHLDTVQRRCSDGKDTFVVRAGVPASVRRAGFAVELVRAGRTPGELAREFECSASAIRNWVRQSDRDEGRREDGLTTAEREDLRRLRRENRQLREEREILKKAAAWFARETGTVPGRSSSS